MSQWKKGEGGSLPDRIKASRMPLLSDALNLLLSEQRIQRPLLKNPPE